MGRTTKSLLLLALATCALSASSSPLRTLIGSDLTLLETSTKLLDSSLEESDSGDSEVNETSNSDEEYNGSSETEDASDGEYTYTDDSETISQMVNEYHSSSTSSSYTSSDVYISGGIEECDDCTSAVVPVGEYDEYVKYFTTEYDEYYLVKVPVTRHDVYTIKEVPETTHSVYYTTGDYVVQDQVTECEDCIESEDSSSSSQNSSSSSSSGESSATSVTKSTSSRSSSSSEEESAEVDTSDRKSSESNASTDTDSSSSNDSSSSSSSSNSNSSSSSTSSSSSSSNESSSDGSTSTTSSDVDENCDVADEMTVTEVSEYDEYIVQEIDGGCEHCDDELFLELRADIYPQLSGDLYDNDETDASYLTLVSPSSDTDQVTWNDVYDGDESEYEDDLEDTNNPAALQNTLLEIDNALGRDLDDLPDDLDDEGDDQIDGDFLFILVTTFDEDINGSGKVIVIPEDDDEENFTLISGLDKPVGLCFDNNNEFLYVTDPTFGEIGYIYQFSIDWDSDDTFTLRTEEYVIVYTGANPNSCFVDEYGNVYFTEASENQINMISYLDLWAGYTNYYYTIYERDDDTTEIDTPVGISVYDSNDLYFVNNNVDNGAPVLAKTEANVKGTNSKSIKRKVEGKSGAWGVAVSEDYVYFTTAEGSLWAMDREDKFEATQKAEKFFAEARGVCYGDDDVYVADFSRGQIFQFSDDDDEESGEVWEDVERPYALYCVNGANLLVLGLLSALALL